MKRKDLIKIIEKHGYIFIRHGGKHDIYQNPDTGISRQFQDIKKLRKD